MSIPVTISQHIVEALYCEALVLSDEVRHAFTPPGRHPAPAGNADLARLARSSEGLRTTTRMMHAITWLLNHRAYFTGQIDDREIRRRGGLSADMYLCEPAQMTLLDPETSRLVEATCRFYERLLRLDRAWRLSGTAAPRAVERLRERIEERLAS